MKSSPAFLSRIPCRYALAFAVLLVPAAGFAQVTTTFTGVGNTSAWTGTSFNNGAGPAPGAGDTLVMNGSVSGAGLALTTDETILNLTDAGSTFSQSIIGNGTLPSTLTITGTLTKTGANGFTLRDATTKVLNVSINDIETSGGGNLGFGSSASSPIGTVSITTANIASTNGNGLLFDVNNGATTSIGTLSITSGFVIIQNIASTTATLSVNSLSGATAASLKATSSAANVMSTLDINATNSSPMTFSGSISDGTVSSSTLTVIKRGTGIQIFAGNNNSYSGGTTITAGTLLLTNTAGSATGSGAVTVNGTGKLGGTGIIDTTGAAIQSGGTLEGGLSTAASGALSINGNLTLSSGSKIELTLGPSLSHSSITSLGGTWTFASDEQFGFDLLSGATTGIYDNIITGLAADPGVSGWTIANAGVTGTFSYDGTDNVDLIITSIAVPEPSTVALMLGAFAVLGVFRRRLQA